MRVYPQIIGDIVHQMQRERGRASLYLISEGQLFGQELLLEFEQSQGIIASALKCLEEADKNTLLPEKTIAKLRDAIEKAQDLGPRREAIMAKQLSATEVIRHYSHKIIVPLIDMAIEITLADPQNDPARVSAYASFINLKERIGRERALGVRGLVSGAFSNSEFMENLRFLLAEQDSYQQTFLTLADTKQRECFTKLMQGKAIDQLNDLHRSLEGHVSIDNIDIGPEDWFHLLTAKIDLMKEVEWALIETLTRDNASEKTTNDTPFVPSSLNRSISQKHQDFILTLPFFKDLSVATLTDLLQHTQVREYKKGQLLFLEGEQANRLYIILDGWAKLFKGTASGEETVMQMLSSGSMITESAVFLNAPYPASCQIAKRATVLTIPAPIIREKVRQNAELAVSVLTSVSRHSHSLIQTFENIRLKTVDERVGWFLLKLQLDQGRVPDMVELPYDKSLIASYLDMKPETLSRTLKRMKDEGYSVTKDAIFLPHNYALCPYCESDTAAECEKHGTAECPNKNVALHSSL